LPPLIPADEELDPPPLQEKKYPGSVINDALQRRTTGQLNTTPAAKAAPKSTTRLAEPKGMAAAIDTRQNTAAAEVRQAARVATLSMPKPVYDEYVDRPRRPRRQVRNYMDDIEYYYEQTIAPHQFMLACLLICVLIGVALVKTPLGLEFGLYAGPRDWSAWVDQTFSAAPADPEAVASRIRVEPLQAPLGENSIMGEPSISAAKIDEILRSYGSPAAGSGQAFYDLGIKYGIDPAYAVAFFIHESSAGTNPGWAGIKPDGSTTHNIGNIICAGYPTCHNRFRDYGSWEEGIEDWYKLLSVEYINGRGAHTVEQIVPIYAPSFENNVPAYIDAVNSLVREWKRG
jgi:hypothetical protein